MTTATIDLERLLKLRVVVGRYGELDLAGWWNTKGQLGPMGATALRRGFPRSYHFAQARSVIAVASHRTAELFSPPRTVNLWHLTDDIEEQFDARWEWWVDHATEWATFFQAVASTQLKPLFDVLLDFELVTESDRGELAQLRRSAEGRAVALSAPFSGTNRDVLLLALGFARGERSEPAIPYARLA